MELGLKGKTVVVTGGASNIGRGISLAFAREGVNLVIADIDVAQGEKTVAEAKTAGATAAICVKTDVTKISETDALMQKAKAQFGKIDVLVNNVGFDRTMWFVDSTPEFWDSLIAVNYKGVLNCTKSVLPIMIEQKKGSIVSIGSDAGRIGEVKEAVYSGLKAGVIAFSKVIAKENGPKGIRANVVCPGLTPPAGAEAMGDKSIWQETIKGMTPEVLQAATKMYPLRRLGTAGDVGNAVVFLASDAANYITGQTLSVSGGYSMV